MIRHGQADELEPWLARAKNSRIIRLHNLAASLGVISQR